MYNDIRKVLDDIKNNWKNFKDRILYASSKFFYKSEFINELIFNQSFSNLPKSEFIDYNRSYKYYESNRKKITIQRNGVVKEIEIPYQELVNFNLTPEVKIHLNAPIAEYVLNDELLSVTDKAFTEFITQRPKTTNGNVLRVNKLVKENTNQFKINLEKANYFEVVRTNLTLDFPLKHDNFSSLRIEDLDSKNELKPFNDSCLTNPLGVSTVLTYHKNGSFYYYMKPRKGDLGIFNNMLGSVSGVVEPPESIDEQFELTEYITKELLRELQEETGLESHIIENNPQYSIIPLAFTRELIRGGKPQYFYLIMIDQISEKEFSRIFKNSKGTEEFKNDWLSNINSYDNFISPEFTANLIYAKEYIQKRQKNKSNILNLD